MEDFMELNMIYNEDNIKGLNKIQDETIDLVIADPPYFKVINQKWDYIWKNEEEYINWSINSTIKINKSKTLIY
jgi:DNA modification methylase